MLTDWLLIRRAAAELRERFAGARVRDVGRLADGRTAIALWRRGEESLLCLDPFGTPPLITIEPGELPVQAEPGFVRALGAALRQTAFLDARTRRGDRLLRLEFGTRSRFGVVDGYSLIVELVPRFGNAILLKGETIVAAAREFSLAENGTRSVTVGHAYQPPPLRDGPPRTLAPVVDDAESSDALYVYRRDGVLQQGYVAPLPDRSGDAVTREPSVLALFAEMRAAAASRTRAGDGDRRRTALAKRLRERERKTMRELDDVARKRERAAERESLRIEGDDIFATLHERPDDASREEAKERAADLFTAYRKLGASLPHLDERERHLREVADAVATLLWEAERAGDADLDDVIEAAARLDPRPGARPAAVRRKKRAPLEYRLASGSRIVVGRTPIENADVTFRIGRPDDLWFHVKDQPSAHVILQRDDRAEFDDADIETAAALAAFHSKAKSSPKVTVDYTRRKYVRKRPAAAPGLVFYTNPKSIAVTPRSMPGP